jgi:hypothetical protein
MFIASTHRRLDMHYTSEAHREKEDASEEGAAVKQTSI